MNKTIVITGASSGLGKAAAVLFAQQGWNVIATMRRPEVETDLVDLANVRLMALDVTNLEQIRSVTSQILDHGEVDVVFNNAGYGLVGPLEGLTDDQIVQEINTNLLGVIRITQAFIPYFRAKQSGLFITTTSIGGLVTFPFNSIYHATKWALEGWSESMAFELAKFNIGIKTVSPGGIKTDFASRSLVVATHEAYTEQLDQVFSAFSDPERQASYSTAEQIAMVVYEAAVDGKNQLRYVAGNDAKAMYAQRNQVGDEVFRQAVSDRFFR